MAFEFRPAARVDVSLLLGLSGGTGSGKTYSALRLANGIAGRARFCVIDTEAGRAQHYADQFSFDHGDLKPPFTPQAYADAILAADAAHYPVIVVDSASHEWAGDGGVLDQHEHELDRMAGTDYRKREACKMAAWIQPKLAHKAMVQKLLQLRAHVILCFRAEPKVEMTRNADGRMEIREKASLVGLHGWIPISEKNLPYELTASFLLMADHPGVGLPIKLQQQHRDIFPTGAVITEQCGARLAAWARGSGATGGDMAVAPPAVAPGTLDAPSAAHTNWADKIAGAQTLGALKRVNAAIKHARATLTEHELTILRALYDDRVKAFSAASADADAAPTGVPPAGAIRW